MTDDHETPETNRVRRFLKGWLKPIVLACVIVFPFRSAVADWHDVPTGSMKPGIVEGDRIFVNKLAYDLKVPFTTTHVAEWSDPQPGDIVVCYSPRDGVRLVKRVVGVPGDVIEMRGNRLLINGEPLAYHTRPGATHAGLPDPDGQRQIVVTETLSDRDHDLLITPWRNSPHTFGPVTVPEGQYLVLGDNRDNSADSRYFGYVPRDQILGRVKGVAMSFDPRGILSPRWDRFFLGLD